MKPPLISVLCTCYNAAEFLAESIESVLTQSCRAFEYVLIDDGSRDETPAIIQHYAARDPRIVAVTKPNTGQPDSLNQGLRLARGAWIARLDADDIALPARLAAQLAFVESHPGTVLVGSGSLEITLAGGFIKQQSFPASHDELVWNLEHIWRFFAHSSAFFSRHHALAVGGYCLRLGLSEDWDLWLRLAGVGRIACLPEALVKTRLHPASLSHQNPRWQCVTGLAATICHLRRKAGLADPSQMSDEHWSRFLQWVEQRQDEEGYFRKSQTRQTLRAIWLAQPEINWATKSLRSLAQLRPCAYGLSFFKETLRGRDLALILAEESLQVIG